MLQQLATEESVRSSGQSGIKQVRVGTPGKFNYISASHVGGGRRGGMAAIHDHSNSRITLGQGEAVVCMVLC